MEDIIQAFKSAQSFLQSNAEKMKSMVIDWANINSGSYHLEGLAQMHQVLQDAFSQLDGDMTSHASNEFEVITNQGDIDIQKTGNILSIKKRWHCEKRIILCGHMDTVFDKSHPFQKVNEPKPNYLNGPGVADMKGGLIVILYALLAFEKTPFADKLGWHVIINADEEIGSLGSCEFLEKQANDASIALVYEPSQTPEGMFTSSRKGSGKFSVVVEGKSAHAGRNFYDGRNAICHLAKLIIDIDKLNDPNKTLTINVGLISGGSALNAVPDRATVKLDVRFVDQQDKQFCETELHQLINQYNTTSDFKVTLYGGFSRPAKPLCHKTEKLFEHLKNVGSELGLPVDWQPSGGCCDGNNFSAKGLAVIDTLGVRGGCIHSDKEFLLCESLLERSELSLLLLMTLAEHEKDLFL